MKRPNILWITTDQQRWDTLGATGNSWVKTPNIDRLAAEGCRFGLAFSQSPVCTPSRGAFLTGRYPRTCRARQNGAAIPETEVLVTKMLADAGYRCGLSGKLHLSPCNPSELGPGGSERRIDDGYTDFHFSHHSGFLGDAVNEYHTWLRSRGLAWNPVPFEGSKYVSNAMTGETSQMAWCTDRAMDFIEERAKDGTPWLFSLNPFDPHHAFDPPEEYLRPYLDRLDEIPLPAYVEGELHDTPLWHRTDHEEGAYGGSSTELAYDLLKPRDHRLIRAAYWAMCDQIDFHVGRLLDALERTGQRENTLVIFTSDHGELIGDHGIYLKGPFFYDCSIRVPLIVNMPGVIEPKQSEALVELMDLPQTLLDAVGMAHHPGMMGRSLWPLLTGNVPAENHREDVYCESYAACHGHNGASEQPAHATMLRTHTHKIAVAHGRSSGELYDLEADPGEHRNVWNDPQSRDVKTELLVRLADRMAFTVDPLPERTALW